MKLVVYPAVEPSRLEKIVEAAASMQVENAPDAVRALDAIQDADALFGRLTAEMLSRARCLRWVQSPTASLEHYIFPALVEHACVLTNMRGLFSDVIADHVLGYVLCFARNFHRYLRLQSRALWAPVGGEEARSNMIAGPGTVNAIDRAHLHLADATMGIVGFGQIGQETARRAAAFGIRVLAVDALPQPAQAGVAEVWPLNRLPDLLAASDFVVIAAPHTPQTEKMFRREQFRQMRSNAYLINIGRGAIVDLADLVAALESGEIAGAGLDVFEVEPLPAEHALWRMENVIVTPHVAGVSPRIAERHLAVVLDNIRRFVRGDPLTNVVNKAAWF